MSDAFDAAWGVLKMPIVPGSLKQIPKMNIHGYPLPIERWGTYEALFDDPVTNERLNIVARQQPGDISVKFVSDLGDERGSGIATNAFIGLGDGSQVAHSILGQESNEPRYAMEGAKVNDEFQRRGYATALYDLVASILASQGIGPLIPSSRQSDDAKAFWGDKKMWPVRDDL